MIRLVFTYVPIGTAADAAVSFFTARKGLLRVQQSFFFQAVIISLLIQQYAGNVPSRL